MFKDSAREDKMPSFSWIFALFRGRRFVGSVPCFSAFFCLRSPTLCFGRSGFLRYAPNVVEFPVLGWRGGLEIHAPYWVPPLPHLRREVLQAQRIFFF